MTDMTREGLKEYQESKLLCSQSFCSPSENFNSYTDGSILAQAEVNPGNQQSCKIEVKFINTGYPW